ncbi:hypothetical protein PT274_02885 [Leuconostocaceae bacterium ESL0958]|nr:hypothetical protein [Leuconostocaceae bacterium ESL0958]
MPNTALQFLIDKADRDSQHIDVVARDETVWATQRALTDLFDVDKTGISRHLKKVYESKELIESATSAKIATVQNESARWIANIHDDGQG